MSDEMQLPDLPKPIAFTVKDYVQTELYAGSGYSEDHMEAYAREAVRVALARQAPAPLSQAVPEGEFADLQAARNALDEALAFAPDSERWGRWNRGVVELDMTLSRHPQPQADRDDGATIDSRWYITRQPQPVTEDARDGGRTGLLKLARYGAAMLHWHRGDNPGESGDIDAITCEEEAIRCGVLEGRNVDEPCCESCVCAPFVGWEVCYFCPDDVKAAKTVLAARAATSGSEGEGR